SGLRRSAGACAEVEEVPAADGHVGEAMDHDHDSCPREEPATSGEESARALWLAKTALDEARTYPIHEGPARGIMVVPGKSSAPPAEPVADPMPGGIGTAIKHYEIIRKLGQGGMGTV